MFNPETFLPKPKEIDEPQEFLISNESILSDEEVMTVVNIVKKALNEWRLLPGMKEEKEECLQQLEHLRHFDNNEITAFFKNSGKVFLNSMPEIIKNKIICHLAFKEAVKN